MHTHYNINNDIGRKYAILPSISGICIRPFPRRRRPGSDLKSRKDPLPSGSYEHGYPEKSDGRGGCRKHVDVRSSNYIYSLFGFSQHLLQGMEGATEINSQIEILTCGSRSDASLQFMRKDDSASISMQLYTFATASEVYLNAGTFSAGFRLRHYRLSFLQILRHGSRPKASLQIKRSSCSARISMQPASFTAAPDSCSVCQGKEDVCRK
jgi:hypothetical protein